MSGQLGRSAVPAVSVLLALVLLAGVVVAALGPSTASAATVLQRGDGVVVATADGERPLAPGDEVPRGGVVTAGRDGAVLRTRDRDTWLSAGAVAQVLDGARQELRSGFAMVDARRGPALELATDAAVVTTPAGAVSRVERGRLVRVGAYAGDPLTVRAAGRRASAEVPGLYQVQVPAGGLPGRTTPLVLTPGDAYERVLAADLVRADEALTDLAGRLDQGGRPDQLVRAALTADVPAAPAPPAGAAASETTLAYLLARAADGDPLPVRYAEVRGLRAEGGSWGVVADLVDAGVAEVAVLVDALLAPDEVAVLAGGGEVDVPALLGMTGSGPAGAAGEGGTPGADAAPAPSGSAPSSPPAPPPPPGDEPPPPPEEEPDAVEALIDTVLGLLPEPPPPPAGGTSTGPGTVEVPALPGAPSPTPSPTPTSGGLLGLLPD